MPDVVFNVEDIANTCESRRGAGVNKRSCMMRHDRVDALLLEEGSQTHEELNIDAGFLIHTEENWRDAIEARPCRDEVP